jgi:hypothetical protein
MTLRRVFRLRGAFSTGDWLMKYHLRSLPLIAMITLGGVNAACSMEFAQHYDGALRMDGNSTWISAEGEITAETPAAFERFLNDALLIFKRQAIVISSRGRFCCGRYKARSDHSTASIFNNGREFSEKW